MFHYFHGKITQFGDKTYIINDHNGLQIHYQKPVIARSANNEVTLFLHPHIDDNNKTIRYYAFDTHDQKEIFENLLKINGIGPKTAFHIAQIPQKDIQEAIKDLNVKFFQNIPGIGPKSAKKILLELKDTIKQDDLIKLSIDEKLLKKIVATLKSLGYEAHKINHVLQKYENPINEETLQEVIKWVIKHI